MRKFIEKEKELPIIAETDVLVCGGGPAGVGAAIAAARQGVSTMIIELQNCLGGVATAGMMSHWVGYSSSLVLPEIYDRTYEKCKAVFGWVDENKCGKEQIHQEAQKIQIIGKVF